MSSVHVIAVTGGPGGGKSTSISVLEQELTNKGYTVFVVEEMATNVINSGANPGVVGLMEFQKMLIKLQLERNNVYDDVAAKLAYEGHNIIIIYDRGIPDCKGFISDNDYKQLLDDIGLTETQIMDYYDGVFHLVTAADGAPEAYTCENNAARTETPEQAIERDKGCMRAWTGHSHLRVITNDGCTFEEKINKLLKEVYTLLGVPIPIETERKFLIEKPDIDKLKTQYNGTTVEIIQTYLNVHENGVERRLRQRGIDGQYTFYYTEKKQISEMSRIETERKITKAEYLELLMDADTSLHQIRKNRTCFVYEGMYFELDEYTFWDDKAILEIELTDEKQEFKVPTNITVIKEVTSDDRYKNRSLAESLGKI